MLKLQKQSNTSGFQHDNKSQLEETRRIEPEIRRATPNATTNRGIYHEAYTQKPLPFSCQIHRHEKEAPSPFRFGIIYLHRQKETAQLVCRRRRRKAKKSFKITSSKKRGAINQSINQHGCSLLHMIS
jgi:hypothetical protein